MDDYAAINFYTGFESYQMLHTIDSAHALIVINGMTVCA